jgi:hypothetical protein
MTNKLVDYDQICTDVAALLGTMTGATIPFKRIEVDVETRDFVFMNMPLGDVRLATADNEALAGQNYYSTVLLEIEIAAFSLSSKAAAAKIRNDLLARTQRLFVENPHYGAIWDSVILGHVDFVSAENTKEGFASSAIMQVQINVYTG